MHNELRQSKKCARWIPHLLCVEQCAERVNICRQWLQMFEPNGPKRLSPPYSPDLAPCDFWLFPKLKSAISGRPFSRIQDLARAVHSHLRSVPASEYANCFQKWKMRMQLCIDSEGHYTLRECSYFFLKVINGYEINALVAKLIDHPSYGQKVRIRREKG